MLDWLDLTRSKSSIYEYYSSSRLVQGLVNVTGTAWKQRNEGVEAMDESVQCQCWAL